MDRGPIPRTLEAVIRDFHGRRAALLKALTTERDRFLFECDPARQNLCLYGYPDESWEVKLPVDEVPSQLPEPVLGINFSRDVMKHRDWLSIVAAHSDSWLLAVATFFAAYFNKTDRGILLNQIIDIPTLYDVVTRSKEKPNANNPYRTKQQIINEKPSRVAPLPEKEDEESVEDEDEHENTLCGRCRGNYAPDEFWICCDVCEVWFHGKCVKITSAKAEHIKQYKCPACTSKKARV